MTNNQITMTKRKQKLIFIGNCDLVIDAYLFIGHYLFIWSLVLGYWLLSFIWLLVIGLNL